MLWRIWRRQNDAFRLEQTGSYQLCCVPALTDGELCGFSREKTSKDRLNLASLCIFMLLLFKIIFLLLSLVRQNRKQLSVMFVPEVGTYPTVRLLENNKEKKSHKIGLLTVFFNRVFLLFPLHLLLFSSAEECGCVETWTGCIMEDTG